MTLLEVVVGLTITGLVVTAGYGALASILDHRERAEHLLDSSVRAADERRNLRSWLSGARLSIEEGGPAFTGLDGTWGHQPDDAITLLTDAATPLGSEQSVMRLALDRDSMTPATGLVATFSEWPGQGKRVVEVDARVTGLDIRYFSIPLGDHGWLPSWVSRSLLPSGIEVTLTGDSLPPLLRVPMVVPVGASR